MIFINIITINTYAAVLEDCTAYKKLSHKYLTCKSTSIIKNAANYQKKEWSKEKKKLNKLKKKVVEK